MQRSTKKLIPGCHLGHFTTILWKSEGPTLPQSGLSCKILIGIEQFPLVAPKLPKLHQKVSKSSTIFSWYNFWFWDYNLLQFGFIRFFIIFINSIYWNSFMDHKLRYNLCIWRYRWWFEDWYKLNSNFMGGSGIKYFEISSFGILCIISIDRLYK